MLMNIGDVKMKVIRECNQHLFTSYKVFNGDNLIQEINIEIVTKERESFKYLLLINTNGEVNHDVFYFINYVSQYDTFNSRAQSIQALKLLYSFAEIIFKDILQLNHNDFANFSRFILGRSINGLQESWELRTSRSVNTHNVYMATVRKYYKHLGLTDNGIFDSSIVSVDKSTFGLLGHTRKRKELKYDSNITRMKDKKVPRFITLDEYKKMKQSLESNPSLLNLRNEVMIDLMYLKGLRIGEVLGLTLEDIKEHPDNKNTGIILLRNRLSDNPYQHAKNSIHPQSENDYKTKIYLDKGVQEIIVPEGIKSRIDRYMLKSRDLFNISDKIISNMLQKAKADSIDSNEDNYYLLLSKNGTPLTSSGWNYWLRSFFQTLDIHTDKASKKTNLSHRFRHGYAMYLINRLNLSLEEVSRYMRHRSITSTYVYYNPTEEEIMAATLTMEEELEQTLQGAGTIEED